jgi:hypothetical protein
MFQIEAEADHKKAGGDEAIKADIGFEDDEENCALFDYEKQIDAIITGSYKGLSLSEYNLSEDYRKFDFSSMKWESI